MKPMNRASIKRIYFLRKLRTPKQNFSYVHSLIQQTQQSRNIDHIVGKEERLTVVEKMASAKDKFNQNKVVPTSIILYLSQELSKATVDVPKHSTF